MQKAEQLVEADLAVARPGFAALEARWSEPTGIRAVARASVRLQAVATRLRERQGALRAEQTQHEQEHLHQLSALAEHAEAVVRQGASASLRDADQALREVKEALDHPGHFPTRRDRDVVLGRLEAARKGLYPLVQQLREDAEWKRWANINVQEELCAQAEALLQEPDIEKASHELRELDARWKQAKEAPKDKAEALWTRFKAARDQVKTRTDAYLARQAEELEENLKKKEALCTKAEALAESTDWLKTADELRALQAEWKAIGPVPRAISQRLWERFRQPCDRFFTRWQEHRNQRSHEWAENLKKKESLCERAEALRESTDWEAAAAELKRLQAEWRTIGAVKKSRSDAVWQRFRAACDVFFDRYKNRDEHARQAAQGAREAICGELEGLLPAGEAGAAAPPELAARLLAAQTAWRQAGGLPQEAMAALEARFTGVRDALLEAFPAAFEGTELDPEASRSKAERLVTRVEALLQELAPAPATPPASSAAELAARLRDALATNTIGGRAAVEAKWQSAANELESAQSAWKRLGPLAGSPDACWRALRRRVRALRATAAAGRACAGAEPSRTASQRGPGAAAPALRCAPDATRSSCSCSRPTPTRPRPRSLLSRSATPACSRPFRGAAARPERAGSASSVRTSARSPSSRAARRTMPDARELRALGRDLFETLLPGDVRRLYDSARSLQPDGILDVVLTSMIDWVADKPWELAFDPSTPGVPRHLLRQLRAQRLHGRSRRAARRRRSGRLRVLVVSSRPRGVPPVAARDETARLRAAFRALVDAGLARVEPLPRATPETPAAPPRGGARRRAALHRPRRLRRREPRGLGAAGGRRGPAAAARLRVVPADRVPARAAPRLPERLRDRARRAQRLEPRRRPGARRGRHARGGREPVLRPRRGRDLLRRAISTPSSRGARRSRTRRARRASRSAASTAPTASTGRCPVLFARDPREAAAVSRALAGPLLLALALRLLAIVCCDRVVADVERYEKVSRHLLDVSWNPYETKRLYPYPPPWAAVEAGAGCAGAPGRAALRGRGEAARARGRPADRGAARPRGARRARPGGGSLALRRPSRRRARRRRSRPVRRDPAALRAARALRPSHAAGATPPRSRSRRRSPSSRSRCCCCRCSPSTAARTARSALRYALLARRPSRCCCCLSRSPTQRRSCRELIALLGDRRLRLDRRSGAAASGS